MLNVPKIGFIGLGRMGQALVTQFLEKSVDVAVFNRSREKTYRLLKLNSEIRNLNSGHLTGVYSIKELLDQLPKPRIILLMVSHGKPVDDVIDQLIKAGLEKNDTVCDCGNSFYKDSVKRYQKLKNLNIYFLDIGTSGGIEGARDGACMMVGGDKKVYEKIKPILEKVTVKDGLSYFGPAGSGHFVKMVHNGVEYGMLQAIGEGFDILANSKYDIDLYKTAKNWSHGSVVRGWLMDLLTRALKKDPKLEEIEGVIGGGSTGEWTVETADELKVEAPVIKESLKARNKSQKRPNFAGKIVAVLRKEFGGHKV